MISISTAVPNAGAGSDARAGVPLLSRNWGWLVVRGILALILGTVAFLFPASALFAFTMVFAGTVRPSAPGRMAGVLTVALDIGPILA
jgi:hypothetical protein